MPKQEISTADKTPIYKAEHYFSRSVHGTPSENSVKDAASCLLLRLRSVHLGSDLTVVAKEDLSKCFWNPKRKLGLTTRFSEIIKLQFGKTFHTLFSLKRTFVL